MARFRPELTHNSAWIAPGAVVVGDVTLHENVSVWFNAVLRADTEKVIIGANTNIQDLAMLHADPGDPAILGENVTVGHRAIVHGAQVGTNTLVGMGAILLNGVQVGENCIIGAGALLTQNKIFPAGVLILGSPAKIIRDVTPEEIAANQRRARDYVNKAQQYAGVD
ncbi:MAG: gamma carbonic anhydrase family protein [Aggregatilineales bacterium]